MFKKLLSLAAAAAIGFGASADIVTDYVKDYSVEGWSYWVMGYIPTVQDGVLVSSAPTVTYIEVAKVADANASLFADCEVLSVNGTDNYVVDGIVVDNTEENSLNYPEGIAFEYDGAAKLWVKGQTQGWYQFFVADGITTEAGTDYTVTVCAKASEETSITLNMGWGWGSGEVASNVLDLTTEFEEHELIYTVGGTGCNLIAQMVFQGEIQWKYIKVTHNEQKSETVWINLIENGDAANDWATPDMPFDSEDRGTICAWGKEDKSDPHPAYIETIDGVRAFVVHGTAMTENPWDNQFWINAPRTFAKDETFRVSFKCKSSKGGASIGTQAHAAPSSYLHWSCLGNVTFGTEWSEFTKDVTVDGSMNGMQSIAFNLNDYTDANDYYITDIKWEIPQIEEGYFVAGDFNDKFWGGAVEMTFDATDEEYVAVVGTTAKPASKVWISTRKGTNSAFLANTLVVNVPDEGIESEEYYDFEAGGSNKSVDLPEAGVWKIAVNEDYGMVCFTFLGTEDGIASILNENAAPVYYNLQGVRVDNPNNGIYIVKRGNKVTKQVIR